MKYELIIETSNKELAVGLVSEERVLFKTQYEALKNQSELTIIEIEKLLKNAKIKAKEITRVIVTLGPGSYTGVRVGITIAKTVASFLKIPLCGISSLAAVAGINSKIISLLDARSNKVFVGVYDKGKLIEEESVVNIEEIHELLVKYPGFVLKGNINFVQNIEKNIDYIENLFALSKIFPNVKDVDGLKPIYLKGSL